MPQKKIIYCTLCFLGSFVLSNAQIKQNYDIGAWRNHNSFHTLHSIEYSNDNIYAVSGNGLFKYNIRKGEYTGITSVNGLSDVNINAVKYSPRQNMLILGYKSGMIDLLQNDEVYPIYDIQLHNSINSKRINNIHLDNDMAFFACDFGLLKVNLLTKEILSTYSLGTSDQTLSVNDVVTGKDSIWVATNKGVYYAPLNGSNLHNFQNWQLLELIPNANQSFSFIEYIGEEVFIAFDSNENGSDTIYQYKNGNYSKFRPDHQYEVFRMEKRGDYFTIINSYNTYFLDEQGAVVRHYYFNGYNNTWAHGQDAVMVNDKLYFAETKYGLIEVANDEERYLRPNSPSSNSANEIVAKNGRVYITGGIPGAKYLGFGMYTYDGRWHNYNGRTVDVLRNIPNLNYVAVDPGNSSHFFATSNGYGVVEMNDTNLVNHFTEDNSTLRTYNNYDGPYIITKGIELDQQGNVWVITSGVNQPLCLYDQNNEWHSYSFNGVLANKDTRSLISTPWGHLWFAIDGHGLVAFDPVKIRQNDITNGYKYLKVTGSDGNIISNNITTLAADKDNYIWMGLDEGGIAVYYNATAVLDYNIQASRIIVEQDGIAQYLLENDRVSSIAVDAGNRKWIGTETSGVYLISEDGTEQILNLNKNNSPLPSDFIRNIGINHATGWVWFATDEGVLSYYSGVQSQPATISKPKIYPNPVRENYHDLVKIKGLRSNMRVKIADVAGNVVFETHSEGDIAFWNMKDFNNKRVSTGVYMVYVSNNDGSETTAGKLFVVSK